MDQILALLDRLPPWFFQACTVILFVGPPLGRLVLALASRMGWTRLEAAAQAAAPFARGAFKLLADVLLRRGGAAVLLIVMLTGCGAGYRGPDPATALEGARDVINAAEPCLVATHDLKIKACGEDASCLDAVRAIDDKIADGLDAFKAFWCALPSEDGCTR